MDGTAIARLSDVKMDRFHLVDQRIVHVACKQVSMRVLGG